MVLGPKPESIWMLKKSSHLYKLYHVSGGSLQNWGSDYGKWFAMDQPDLWLDQVVSLYEVKCHLICIQLVQHVVVVCIRLFCGHWTRILCPSTSRGAEHQQREED